MDAIAGIYGKIFLQISVLANAESCPKLLLSSAIVFPVFNHFNEAFVGLLFQINHVPGFTGSLLFPCSLLILRLAWAKRGCIIGTIHQSFPTRLGPLACSFPDPVKALSSGLASARKIIHPGPRQLMAAAVWGLSNRDPSPYGFPSSGKAAPKTLF